MELSKSYSDYFRGEIAKKQQRCYTLERQLPNVASAPNAKAAQIWRPPRYDRCYTLERELRATQLAARSAKEQFGKRLGSKLEEAARLVKPFASRSIAFLEHSIVRRAHVDVLCSNRARDRARGISRSC